MDNLSAFALTWFYSPALGLNFFGTRPTQLILSTTYSYDPPEEWLVPVEPNAPATPLGFVLMNDDGDYRAGLYMMAEGSTTQLRWDDAKYEHVAPLNPLLDWKIVGLVSDRHSNDFVATPRTVCYANGKSFRYPEKRMATWVLVTQPLKYS